MELEDRVQALEYEVKMLKQDIQKTLLAIQATLPARPGPMHWQKQAWVLALVNMLLAIVLFTNIYLYLPVPLPFPINDTLLAWLRALWLALAFVWLLLQLYPLALLLGEEEREAQGVAWRNASAFIRTRPSFLVILTLAVLVISIVNSALPAVWLFVSVALLIAVVSIAVRNLLDVWQERAKSN